MREWSGGWTHCDSYGHIGFKQSGFSFVFPFLEPVSACVLQPSIVHWLKHRKCMEMQNAAIGVFHQSLFPSTAPPFKNSGESNKF